MTKRKAKPAEKKKYEKPTVQRVQLHPEESMAVGCKNITLSGPAANPCLAGSCFGDGS